MGPDQTIWRGFDWKLMPTLQFRWPLLRREENLFIQGNRVNSFNNNNNNSLFSLIQNT